MKEILYNLFGICFHKYSVGEIIIVNRPDCCTGELVYDHKKQDVKCEICDHIKETLRY